MRKTTIDLNADLGEGSTSEHALIRLVSSANIACGAHAGSIAVMAQSLRDAKAAGVVVGAHPGFPDPDNFGRVVLSTNPERIMHWIRAQMDAFCHHAHRVGVRVDYVKPHGALYHLICHRRDILEAFLETLETLEVTSSPRHKWGLMLMPTPLTRAYLSNQTRNWIREGFLDRNYEEDRLVPRQHAQAHVALSEGDFTRRSLRLIEQGVVRDIHGRDVEMDIDSVCLHGDTPQALARAEQLVAALRERHIDIAHPIASAEGAHSSRATTDH
jgi:UPF0271 protein